MTELSRRAFLATAAGVAGIGQWACRDFSPLTVAQPWNVLVIVLDTVRFDRFEEAGGFRAPLLHRASGEGISFVNAWANSSWSLPSQASILTGRYPFEHGADWPDLGLKSGVPTIASVLARAGYVTGVFSSNSAWVTPEYLGRDVLRFKAYSFENHLRRTTQGRVMDRLLELVGSHSAGRGRHAETVNSQFVDFLDDYPGRPFFGYLCHMDVNQAFHRVRLNRPVWSEPATVEQVVAAYDYSLTQLDLRVSQLLDELRTRRLLERTVVMITSDHGESFGREWHGDHDPSGHGSSLYPEQTRVPLIVLAPGLRRGVVDTPVSLRSIAPTIYHLLGIDLPLTAPILPVDSGSAAPLDPAFLTTLRYDRYSERALVTSRWLYRLDLVKQQEQLFDLQTDPLAQTDVAEGNPELSRLRERCEQEMQIRRN